MENDTTAKSKRWKIHAFINLFLAILIAVTLGANAMIARADTSDDNNSLPAEEWYQLNEEGEMLGVFLRSSVSGYEWKYGLSSDRLRQLHDHEIDKDDFGSDDETDDDAETWKLYLAPKEGEEGEVIITFVCVRDKESDSIDTRTLKVRIRDGRMLVVDETP